MDALLWALTGTLAVFLGVTASGTAVSLKRSLFWTLMPRSKVSYLLEESIYLLVILAFICTFYYFFQRSLFSPLLFLRSWDGIWVSCMLGTCSTTELLFVFARHRVMLGCHAQLSGKPWIWDPAFSDSCIAVTLGVFHETQPAFFTFTSHFSIYLKDSCHWIFYKELIFIKF